MRRIYKGDYSTMVCKAAAAEKQLATVREWMARWAYNQYTREAVRELSDALLWSDAEEVER